MIEMKIPVQKFDVKGFAADILRFLKEEGIGGETPETVIAEVMEDGSTPYWGDSIPNRDILHELLEEGKALFFTFSNTNVGEPIMCADGKSIQLDEEDDEDAEESQFYIGESEVVGFVLQVLEGDLTIQTVVHGPGAECSQAPSVEEIEDAGPFEQGMTEYLNRFMR